MPLLVRLLLAILSIAAANRRGAAAFAPPVALSLVDGLKSVLGGAFSPAKGGGDAQSEKRSELKAALLSECRSGGATRGTVGGIIDELAPLCPTEGAASSPLLRKKWILEWTTEKEINFFSDWGISGTVSQTVDGDRLGNDIEFKKGGGLSVSGELSVADPDEGRVRGARTNFRFTTATLDLGRWGVYNLPPVGEGWFETIYLDEDLRVDTNSRDDILVCTPEQQL